jgi:hypothetical protein
MTSLVFEITLGKVKSACQKKGKKTFGLQRDKVNFHK